MLNGQSVALLFDCLTWHTVTLSRLLSSNKLQSTGTCCDTCELCDKAASWLVGWLCVECEQFYCRDHSAVHKKLRTTKNHKQVKMKDEKEAEKLINIKQSTTTTSIVDDEDQMKVIKCNEHKNEAMEWYCVDCELIECMECLKNYHYTHKHSTLNDEAMKSQQQLKDMLERDKVIEGIEARLDDQKKSYLHRMISSTQSWQAVRQSMDDKFDRLIRLIEDRPSEMHAQVTRAQERQWKVFEVATDRIESLKLRVEAAKKVAEDRLKSTVMSDAVGIVGRLSRRLRVIEEQAKQVDIDSTIEAGPVSKQQQRTCNTCIKTDKQHLKLSSLTLHHYHLQQH
jgi:hypothetical protein